jgi:hypothetical protein
MLKFKWARKTFRLDLSIPSELLAKTENPANILQFSYEIMQPLNMSRQKRGAKQVSNIDWEVHITNLR